MLRLISSILKCPFYCSVGKVMIFGRTSRVLIDTGETHSIIASNFAVPSGVESEMIPEIQLITPFSGEVSVTFFYRHCQIGVGGRWFPGNLLVLEDLLDFDAILGMDWLSSHRAVVDCQRKTVTLLTEGGELVLLHGGTRISPIYLISAYEARREMMAEEIAYLAIAKEVSETERRISDIPVAAEFPDVFTEELLSMPPQSGV